MKWTPYINAVISVAYIFGIALIFRYVRSIAGNTPDSIVDPIAALSLLVFSVSFMGLLFFYRPVVLLLDNKREEALFFFLKNLGTFAVFIILLIILLIIFK